jgi:hypothetical protein
MILSYRDLFHESKRRTRIKAELTTEHPASSCGQPVIVLDDGGLIDLLSWVSLDYCVVCANKKESQELARMGLLD